MLVVPVAVIGVVAAVGLGVLWPSGHAPPVPSTVSQLRHDARASVTAIVPVACVAPGGIPVPIIAGQPQHLDCSEVHLRLTSGQHKGTQVVAGDVDRHVGNSLRNGSKVIVSEGPSASGVGYTIIDRQRGLSLWLLAALFAAAVVALGRLRGLRALVGLTATFVLLRFFALPSILQGHSPLGVALVTALAGLVLTLYLTHGWRSLTHVAVIGTAISLALTAVVGAFAISGGHFSGFGSDEAETLSTTLSARQVQQLILAGLIIGALGVLYDVTVTQAAAVDELYEARPELSRREAARAGLRIGREHVAATVNTLFLAYAGAALPLLLYVTLARSPLENSLTSEVVGAEIVRGLAGSIGLVAAVPITTLLAAWALGSRGSRSRAASG
jgi:uncharacterized membrane protein